MVGGVTGIATLTGVVCSLSGGGGEVGGGGGLGSRSVTLSSFRASSLSTYGGGGQEVGRDSDC